MECTIFIQKIIEIPFKLWALLAAGPVLFLLGIICASILLSIRGVPAPQIPEQVPGLVSHILVGVLLCLMALMMVFASHINEVWTMPDKNKVFEDVAIGVIMGAILAFAYIYWFAPLIESLQRTIGDYVQAGSVLPVVSNSIVLFFIANVLLAPLVEETLYRGIATPLIEIQLGTIWSVILTCFFFGLLHWVGGIWYMILTGVVAGGLFTGLYYFRGGIIAPFAAHLTLNLIEFIYAYHIQSQS